MNTTYVYRCSLVRVVDADTVIVTIDLGFRLTATMPVRLYGINAPELKTAEGKAARAWVIDWFAEHTDLQIETQKDPEKFGRWLGTISPLAGGKALNDELVDRHQAVAWDGRGRAPTLQIDLPPLT